MSLCFSLQTVFNIDVVFVLLFDTLCFGFYIIANGLVHFV